MKAADGEHGAAVAASARDRLVVLSLLGAGSRWSPCFLHM
jgi:hypothetical protein